MVTPSRFSFRLALIITLLLAAIPGIALAGGISQDGVFFIWPDYPLNKPALLSCQPWMEKTASMVGVKNFPVGSTVKLTFVWVNPYGGPALIQPTKTFENINANFLLVPVDYPRNPADWPYFDPQTGESAIAAAASIQVIQPDGTLIKLSSKQWWVRCVPER